jgi:tRNA-modifying protein YgfZ
MTQGYEALCGAAAVVDLAGRGLIVARGRDRVRFFHNITSNDVRKLTPGAGCYAFLLTPQGRIQADLNLFCFDDRFLLDTEPELGEKVSAHIRRYIVADQVELEDVSGQQGAVGIEGPGAATVLASLGAPVPAADYAHAPWGEATVAAVSATGQPGFRIFSPDLEGVRAKLLAAGAVAASAQDARVVRIENGKPRYGEDIVETSLPQETRQMHAISFQKGCYLGQEIVERIRARGHVNRTLVRIEAESKELGPGARVWVAGVEAGEVTSVAWSERAGRTVALAYVRVPHNEPGTAVEVGGAAAVVAG